MPQTSREIVTRCLRFEHPERMPRDVWCLPWAEEHLADTVAELRRRFPRDFGAAEDVYRPSPRRRGDPYEKGIYVDEWGCTFTSIQRGAVGEVRQPLIAPTDVVDVKAVTPPLEILPADWAAARDTGPR